MIFTEFGCPFVLKSDNGPCYSSREFHDFLQFYQIHHITSSPHHPQSNGFAEALVGFQKIDGKVHQGWKMWNCGLLQYRVTPISSTIPSPLEALTGRRLRTSLPQIPSSIGKSVENSRIHQELMKCQTVSTSTNYNMELKPVQPVFMKEVHGNVWRTGTIDQPAKEPDSYWIKFPDSSILRRTRSMIKPRSLPSHFELETESKERNISEFIPSHSSINFQSMLPGPEHPALPIGNPVTPPLSERGTASMRQDILTSSPGVTQPSILSPAVLRRSTHANKGVLPRRFSPSKELTLEHCGKQWRKFHFEQ